MARLGAFVACCALLTACGATASSRARDPVRFVSRGPHRTLVVVETHVPRSIGFRQFARNEPKMLRLALHARDIRVREATYRGRRALRVAYSVRTKKIVQYFVRNGELMYVSTYTYR
jgi:hypothetical protein